MVPTASGRAVSISSPPIQIPTIAAPVRDRQRIRRSRRQRLPHVNPELGHLEMSPQLACETRGLIRCSRGRQSGRST
jgi:hypothetical protein